MEMDTPAGGALLSSPADLFARGGGGPEPTASTGPAQRQSPWPLGPSPRTTAEPPVGVDGPESAGGGGVAATAAVSGVPAAGAFSPRLGDGQFSSSRAASFYGAETDASPPRLQPSADYRPTSGKNYTFSK